MASRVGGISGAVIGLVVCVFLFVISTALAVLFYTQKADAEKQTVAAQEELADFINAATAQSNSEYLDLKTRAAQNNIKVYDQMIRDQQSLKIWLTGDPGKTLAEVEQAKKDASVGDGENALTKVVAMQAAAETAAAKAAAAEERNTAMQGRLTRLEEDIKRARAAAAQTHEQLRAQLVKQNEQYEAHVAKVKDERDELERTYEQAKADFRTQLRGKDGEISALKGEVTKRDGRIEELTRIVEGRRMTSPDMTLEHDGRITRVDAGEDIVYINLGRNDRVVLGQTFEVFDQQIGVQTERNLKGQVQHTGGKATIEVIRFAEDGRSATARVVRQPFGSVVVAGDLISNIVYDRDRKFRFFVAGDFDVDGDDRPTAGERQRVKTMIQQWGGVAIDAEKMPVDTDFLVMGREPGFPTRPDEATATEDDWRRFVEQREKATSYQELVGLAKELSVPILTQNRFYTLIGFYDR